MGAFIYQWTKFHEDPSTAERKGIFFPHHLKDKCWKGNKREMTSRIIKKKYIKGGGGGVLNGSQHPVLPTV